MKKTTTFRMIFATIIITITALLAFYKNPNLHPTSSVKPIEFSAGTILIPEDTIYYLQNSLLYGNYYNENQKFVIYLKENAYPDNFLSILEKIKNSPQYSQYAFLPRTKENPEFLTSEQIEDKKLIEICHQFCIINPAKEELFFIHGIKAEDAQELPHIFQALENW